MSNLNKYERETIILWNQSDEPVSIYTFDKPLIWRLEHFATLHPELCRLERESKEGSKTYLLEKSRLSVRFISPMCESHKKQARDRAKQRGFGAGRAAAAENE